MDRAELKRRAREQLGNRIFGSLWLYAVLAGLVYAIIMRIIGMVPFVGMVISLLVTGPLAYGLDRMYLKQSRDGAPMQMGELFRGFSGDFGGLFLLGLLQSIFIALWSLLLIVPGIIAALSYSMSYYIKVDNPNYTWKQCLDASKQITNGHKGELFVLYLSFIGWYLVGALCLGVGVLWADAYFRATRAQFYKSIRQ